MSAQVHELSMRRRLALARELRRTERPAAPRILRRMWAGWLFFCALLAAAVADYRGADELERQAEETLS